MLFALPADPELQTVPGFGAPGREETKKRVETSQKSDYQLHSPNMAMNPWSSDQNKASDQWNYVPFREYFDEDWSDGLGDNECENWTRIEWQGPPP